MSRSFQLFLLLLLLGAGFFLVTWSREKKEEKKIQEKSETLVTSIKMSKKSSASALSEYHLRVISEPDQAEIWIDGAKKNTAPFEFVISPQAQHLTLKLEGYDAYERQIPAAKDAEGDLVWKIQMKKSSVAYEKYFLHGQQDGWLLQLRSVPASELNDQLTQWADQRKAKLCRATVDGEQRIKVVRGPFAKKNLAEKELRSSKKHYVDAFITRLNCAK